MTFPAEDGGRRLIRCRVNGRKNWTKACGQYGNLPANRTRSLKALAESAEPLGEAAARAAKNYYSAPSPPKRNSNADPAQSWELEGIRRAQETLGSGCEQSQHIPPSPDRLIPKAKLDSAIANAMDQSGQSSEAASMAEAEAKSATKTDPETFAILLTAYGAVLGAGVLQIAARDWYFGSIFAVGGGVGLMSILPSVRPKLRVMRSTRVLWAVVMMTWLFLGANLGFALYDHFWPVQRGQPQTNVVSTSPERWLALTPTQTDSLASRVRFIPPENIVVACETLNCKDLADGIADLLRKTAGWKVSILHHGGLGIDGVAGIHLNPDEPATQALKEVIEATTGLAVTVGPDTRKGFGGGPAFLVVGIRPF